MCCTSRVLFLSLLILNVQEAYQIDDFVKSRTFSSLGLSSVLFVEARPAQSSHISGGQVNSSAHRGTS